MGLASQTRESECARKELEEQNYSAVALLAVCSFKLVFFFAVGDLIDLTNAASCGVRKPMI